MSAAGVPPSRTIASTNARKLPDISRRCLLLGFALVSIAHRSLTTANANSDTSSGRFHVAVLAATAANPVAATSAVVMTALAVRLGSGIVKALPTALFIGTKRAQLECARATCQRSAVSVAHTDSLRSERRHPERHPSVTRLTRASSSPVALRPRLTAG